MEHRVLHMHTNTTTLRHFVSHFPPLQYGAVFSCPAFSSRANWCRKFMSRIFRSCIFDRPVFSCLAFSVAPRRYYLGCKIQKWVTWLWPRPFQGRFFIGRVGLAIINQYKKLKSLGSPVTKLRLSILFNFNRNYAAIWYRFRHIASHLSKVADFNLPHLHLAPPQRSFARVYGWSILQRICCTGLSLGLKLNINVNIPATFFLSVYCYTLPYFIASVWSWLWVLFRLTWADLAVW